MTKLKFEMEFEVREEFDIQEPGPTATPDRVFQSFQEQFAQLAQRKATLQRFGFCLVSMKRVD